MNNKLKVVSGIMVAAMATLTVNLIGSKEIHANAAGDLDRGGDMFASGSTVNPGGELVLIFVVADFNQDGFDDFVAIYDRNDMWVSLYEEGGYVKTWQIPREDVSADSRWKALDVNGDGYPDLIASSGWPGTIGEAPVYINQLGSGLACNTDLNDDGTVNITDLLVLIADWGDCS